MTHERKLQCPFQPCLATKPTNSKISRRNYNWLSKFPKNSWTNWDTETLQNYRWFIFTYTYREINLWFGLYIICRIFSNQNWKYFIPFFYITYYMVSYVDTYVYLWICLVHFWLLPICDGGLYVWCCRGTLKFYCKSKLIMENLQYLKNIVQVCGYSELVNNFNCVLLCMVAAFTVPTSVPINFSIPTFSYSIFVTTSYVKIDYDEHHHTTQYTVNVKKCSELLAPTRAVAEKYMPSSHRNYDHNDRRSNIQNQKKSMIW